MQGGYSRQLVYDAAQLVGAQLVGAQLVGVICLLL